MADGWLDSMMSTAGFEAGLAVMGTEIVEQASSFFFHVEGRTSYPQYILDVLELGPSELTQWHDVQKLPFVGDSSF